MTRPRKGKDVWFSVGRRWCWRCLRFTKHLGHEQGKPVCVRCAQKKEGAGEDKREGTEQHRKGRGG